MKKFSTLLFLLLFIPSFVFAQTPSPDLQLLIQQLQAQIKLLQNQIIELKSQLEATKKETTATQEELKVTKEEVKAISEELKLTRFLRKGESGEEVRKLQEYLSQFPDIYPEKLVTGFFGALTEAAVKRFQEKHNIVNSGTAETTGYGQIGPRTIAKVNELLVEGAGRPYGASLAPEAGAGKSEVIPPGLLMAPGILKKMATETPELTVPTIPTATTVATATPSGVIPAVPAIPATPAVPSSGVGTAIPATPATPAVPAATSASTATDTTPPSVILTGPYLGLSPTCLVLYSSSYSDNVAVFGVQKKIDGVNYGPEDTGSALNSSPGFTGTSSGCVGGYLTDGIHTFTMVVRDAAGNVTTKSITISIPFTGTATTTTSTTTTATTTPITPEADYTPPSIPTNLTATAASSTQINLSWTAATDNVAVTGYRIYRGGVQIATVTTGTSYSDTGLTAATTYSYTIAAYDAAGNVSAQSSPVTVTTLTTAISDEGAPSQVIATGNLSTYYTPLGGPAIKPQIKFNYTTRSTTQAFNVYYKKPNDAAFTKYTFGAGVSVDTFSDSQGTSLYRYRYPEWQWEWQWDGIFSLSQNVSLGTYQAYVTAIDKNDVEGPTSAIVSFEIYSEPTIVSPINNSTISASPAPTLSINGSPGSDYASNYFAISKVNSSGFRWTFWSTGPVGMSVQGPTLDPNGNPHILTVFSKRGYDVSRFAVSIFNVSTTTASIDSRVQNLAAIAQTLNEIKEKLAQLLQGQGALR